MPDRIEEPYAVLEGVYLERTAAGLKPRFLKGEPPSDADIAAVLQKISRRVIRELRHLGYLEAGSTDAVATGYDPLRSATPELARPLAVSVTQRIAFGERAEQHVRRIGSEFGYEGERPEVITSGFAGGLQVREPLKAVYAWTRLKRPDGEPLKAVPCEPPSGGALTRVPSERGVCPRLPAYGDTRG